MRTVDRETTFRAAYTERCGAEVHPDSGLIQTMESAKQRELIFNAGYTLMDIVNANLRTDDDDDDDMELEDRMGNVEKATGEFLQVVNALMMGSFGGGRSAPVAQADNTNMTTQTTNETVKPEGADAGTVKPEGVIPGGPDLSRFEEAQNVLRQAIIDGDEEKIQAALDALGPVIVDTLETPDGAPSAPQNEAVENLASRMSGLEAQFGRLIDALENQPSAPPVEEGLPAIRRPYAPRRRSFAPGPAPASVTRSKAPAPGQPRKISEVVRESVGLPSYP
jgi:hypothetical protein